MRLSGTKTGSANQYNGLGDQLYDLGGAKPTLDLNFASNGSLVDSVTGKTLVTHTRQSNATYVDGDGIIKDAVTNLILQSEDFSTTWSSNNYTITAGFNSPDGSATANKIVRDTTLTSASSISQNVAVSSSTAYTYSVFAKAGEYSKVAIREGVSTGAYLSVDLSNGTEIDSSLIGTPSIIAYSDGWYRISFTLTTAVSQTSFGCRIYALPDSYTSGTPVFSWAGNDADGIYLWGAQLEESSTVGQYVKTTTAINSAPRFDHDPTTGESLGLLVEESRTNYITDSSFQNFGSSVANTQWFEVSSSFDVTSNQVVSPDGGTNAASYYINTGTGYQATQYRTGLATGTDYVFSVFVKAGAVSDDVTLFLGGDITVNFIRAVFTLTGAGSYSASVSNGTAVVASNPTIQAVGNGWYRCTLYATFTSPTNVTSLIYPGYYISQAEGTTTYVWGAQLEAGSFPTSYIPTEGSTVTRAADVASITGRNFGSVNLVEYSEEFDKWVGQYTVVKPNALTAPNGTQTADLLIDTTDNQQHNRAFTSTVTGTKTFSVYAKASSSSRLLRLIDYNATDGAQSETYYNIETGVKLSGPGTITSAGNGWYRCSIQSTTTVTSNVYTSLATSVGTYLYAGDGTSGLYLWGAQLEEGSTATDYIKSDVNWTSRASNATYYDVNGTLKKSSYNELTYSEEFDQWANTNTTVTVDSSVELAPDGTATADKIIESASNGQHYIEQTVTAAAGTYTHSFFVKAAEYSHFTFRPIHLGENPTSSSIVFDLNTGPVTTTDGLITNATMEVLADGWRRCSVTLTLTSAVTLHRFRVHLTQTAGGTLGYTGDGTSGLYLWGAQVETGPYAGDYAKTEGSAASTARTAAYLPDGNGNFVSAGDLLLEGAATNLLLRSEEFTSASWTLFGSATRNADVVTAPNGTSTADSVTLPIGSGIYQGLTGAAGITYTFSIWLKSDSAQTVKVLINTNLSDPTSVTVNVTTTWQRFSVTKTTSAGTTFLSAQLDTGNNGTFYIWGAQLEESSFPTSYIPTSGSTATRAADVSTSAATFGNSWYEQDEGTVFADSQKNYNGSTGYPRIVQISDATNNNALLMLWAEPVNRLYATVTVSGSPVADIGNNTLTQTAAHKSAFGYKINDFAVSNDGLSVQADTSGTVPTVDRIFIGKDVGASYLNGTINRLTYWPTRLSNDTLQTITV